MQAGELQLALAQYTTAISEPDDSSQTQQNTFELTQVHQSRGAVLHMLGRDYSEDSAAAESMGVQNAHATIAKVAVQMAQAFPGCLEAATDQVKAAVKKEEGNTLLKAKKFAEALEVYTAALELDPNEHTIWYVSHSIGTASERCVVSPAWFDETNLCCLYTQNVGVYTDRWYAYSQVKPVNVLREAVPMGTV